MASKTPNQEEDENVFNPNEMTSPNFTTPTKLPEKQIDVILTMVTQSDGETDDEYWCRQAFVKQQLNQHGTDTSSDTDYSIQLVAKSWGHHPVMNQHSPQEEPSVFLGKLKDLDIQRMIHLIRDGKFPPNYGNFANKFLQKLFKNRNRLEVNHNVPYWKFFEHTGKVTSKQIVVLRQHCRWHIHDTAWWPHAGTPWIIQNVKKNFANGFTPGT